MHLIASVALGSAVLQGHAGLGGRGAAFPLGSIVPQDMLQGLSRLGVVIWPDYCGLNIVDSGFLLLS